MADAQSGEGGHTSDEQFFFEEVYLAFRNRGTPSEALRMPITPTGLHYLLNHFDIPEVDASTWTLTIDGNVGKPLKLNLEDIKSRPSVTFPVTFECAGNGRAFMKPRPVNQPWIHGAVSTAEWTGTPLSGLLEEAGIGDGACEVLFTGLDRGIQGGEDQYYQRSLRLDEANRDEVILAYEMNGAPLEPQHGYPLRLVVPGWYGMTNVKWLDRIEVIDDAFNGFQMLFYRETPDPEVAGAPVETMKVRGLMAPPGIQVFPTLDRQLDAGPIHLVGRAWAGRSQVSRVEISTDGGKTWNDAELDDPIGQHAWRGWRYTWQAPVGHHVLMTRATDSQGNTQPSDPVISYYGVANNGIERIEVDVV